MTRDCHEHGELLSRRDVPLAPEACIVFEPCAQTQERLKRHTEYLNASTGMRLFNDGGDISLSMTRIIEPNRESLFLSSIELIR
jgi:hypothetical protein